jgi:hypothetical protein
LVPKSGLDCCNVFHTNIFIRLEHQKGSWDSEIAFIDVVGDEQLESWQQWHGDARVI